MDFVLSESRLRVIQKRPTRAGHARTVRDSAGRTSRLDPRLGICETVSETERRDPGLLHRLVQQITMASWIRRLAPGSSMYCRARRGTSRAVCAQMTHRQDRVLRVRGFGMTPEGARNMDLDRVLVDARPQVLDEAYAALQRSHVTHYEAAGERFTRERLAHLFALVVDAIRDRDLAAISAYCEQIAVERFDAGFDISEVQTAFNALEEAMWRRVVSASPEGDLAEAIGLLSTVIGFGKDALARRYVSLACRRHVPSLDLSALFQGTSS
jgi:hypothetical protein